MATLALVGCKKTVDPTPRVGEPVGEPLPVDPGVRRGTLDNGLTYFIEANKKPENRAVLRLALDAGSLQEDDDQLGVAHFLEHMAFNGTEAYPENDLIAYLESVGTQFGPHLNAHTSFDETVYKLTVPTDDAEVFANGLSILEQWACCLTLDPEAIEAERGVVLEEWRLRQGLQDRISEVRIPMTYANSRYAERLPIGTEQSLISFDPDVVGRFYDDWYRPDLMAVIVVGDVDVDQVESAIRSKFSGLSAKQKKSRTREEYDIPPQDRPLRAVFADPEMPASVFDLRRKHDAPQHVTREDWVQEQLLVVSLHLLNARLSRVAQDPDASFLAAAAGSSRLTPTEGVSTLQIRAKEGRELDALEDVLREMRRFALHGALPDELDRARAVAIENMDMYQRESRDTHSMRHADEIVRHFLQNEMMTGTVYEAELSKEILAQLTVEAVDDFAKTLFEGDVDDMLLMPEKEGLVVPSVEEMAAVFERVSAEDIEPPRVLEVPDELVARPAPSEIVERDESLVDALGWERWTLANGAVVYARRTELKTGQILFRGFRAGGLDAVDDDAFVTAWSAARIHGASGAGAYDRDVVTEYLKGRTVGVSVSLNPEDSWVAGNTSSRDLGHAFEQLYLHFEEPRFTEDGMALALSRWKANLENRRVGPEARFADAWKHMFWPDDPRRKPLTPEHLDSVELDAARQIWSRALGSPEEWTFAFIGDLPEDFEEQARVWIGGLSSKRPGFDMKDRGYHRKPGVHRDVVEAGSADRARYRTEFWTKLKPGTSTRKFRIQLNAFAEVLAGRLRGRLREDLGGVYGVQVESGVWKFPYEGLRLRVEFQCDPDRVEELEAAMIQAIEDIQENGVTEEEVASQRAKNREWNEDSLQTNGRWLSDLTGSLRDDEDPRDTLSFLDYNDDFTVQRVTELATLVFGTDHRGTLILLPEPR